ncbi:unnamed protein product [Closterium sp. NIES-54]
MTHCMIALRGCGASVTLAEVLTLNENPSPSAPRPRDSRCGRSEQPCQGCRKTFSSAVRLAVGTSKGRQHDPYASSGSGGGTGSTTGTGSDSAESIAEWRRRSAEAGAHFFPLQRAEDAPSREEIHHRILVPRGVGGGLRGKGEAVGASDTTWFPLPMLDYNSTLVSTANGTLGNTMVNYSTFAGNKDKIRLPVYPYYVNLKLGSQKQEFSMALNLFLSHTCSCLQCASMRKGPHVPLLPIPFRIPFPLPLPLLRPLPIPLPLPRPLHLPLPLPLSPRPSPSPTSPSLVFSLSLPLTLALQTTYSKPFSTLSSTTLKYISCVDQRCQKGVESGYYGCSTEGLPNYLNLTGKLPGDDALCVYNANAANYDYYEADWEAFNNGMGSYLESVGHVVEDTSHLSLPVLSPVLPPSTLLSNNTISRMLTPSFILSVTAVLSAALHCLPSCGVNQQGHWGMQGWEYGSWSAGGVLGLGWNSPFLYQLTSVYAITPVSFAVCLAEPMPTNRTGWDGKVPLMTGSSHLVIGAFGLTKGAANYTHM